jgi:hypothetical protein
MRPPSAWRGRPSQRNELRLHGARNLFYAATFFTLGWFEAHGWWAILLIAVLVAELIITLIDFVEEDLTRKLPPSERVNHTLLTLNYGAILALLVPVLLGWATEPTGMQPAYYGIWSMLMAIAAAGTVVSGLRDLQAAARLGRLRGYRRRRWSACCPGAGTCSSPGPPVSSGSGWLKRWRAPAMTSPSWCEIR